MSIDKIIRGLLSIPYFLLLWVVELGERSGRVPIAGATPAGDPPQRWPHRWVVGERPERRLARLATLTDDELRADVEKHRQWILDSIRLPSSATHTPLVDEVLLRANSIRHAEEELARRRPALIGFRGDPKTDYRDPDGSVRATRYRYETCVICAGIVGHCDHTRADQAGLEGETLE